MKTNNEEQRAKWREQKRKYRQRTATYSLSFSKAESKELETLANERQTDTAAFLKQVIAAHLRQNGYVLPAKGQLDSLVRTLRSAATNINQLARYVHLARDLSHADLQKLQQQLIRMEQQLEQALVLPPTIEEVLDRHLAQRPDSLDGILAYLQNKPKR